MGDYADMILKDPESMGYGRAVAEHWEYRPDLYELVSYDRLFSDLAGQDIITDTFLNALHNFGGKAVFFVSGRKPITMFHADPGESFVLHTEGTKRWRFFGSENSMLFKPRGMVKNVG